MIDSKSPDMKRNPLSIISIRRTILILLVCFISIRIMAQKVNLDPLDIDQLNLYKDKAVKMRNAGMILTSSGVGILIASNIVGFTLVSLPSDEDHPWGRGAGAGLGVLLFGNGVGLATTVVGIPLWAIGGSRKANAELYTLDIDQLVLYKHNAVTMRNTGMILTLSGIGVAGTGIIIYLIEYGSDFSFIIGMVSTMTTIVGIPLWAAGGSRKAKAELALQKFSIAPENSTAVGLGITIRF